MKHMSLFDSFKRTKSDYTHPNSNVRIIYFEDYLEHILDMIMRFFDVYSSVRPKEECCLFISQKLEVYNDVTYGHINFQILVGSWQDGLLYQYSEIDNYMKKVFEFDPQEMIFTFTKFRTGSSVGCEFPTRHINALLQKGLDNYEAKHPSVKFERYSLGAKYERRC